MNKTRTFVAFIIALVITSGVLAVGWIGSNARVSTYAGQLEDGYQKSFGELVSNINNVEVNLSKAIISTDELKKQELYQKINEQCTLCATNLSNLPVNHQSIVETTKFVNQLGGFSYYLSQKLKGGGTMTSADTSSVNDLYNWCVYVQTVVNDYANNMGDSYSILQGTSSGDTSSSFDSMFANTSATGTEYPTLIYDGPFSDSQKNKQILGLTGETITKEDAENILRNAFSQYNVSSLNYVTEVSGKFESYNFSFQTAHRIYYADVTKTGGLLLSVSSTGTTGIESISLLQAEKEAESFAKNLGLKDMQSVWSSNLNGTAYINLAPVINNVIVYPDMIKAKVSLDTGSILGWEAQSYAYNHTERKDFGFVITAEDALQKVNKSLNVLSAKKCIIPQDYGTEQLCYEYKCTYNNYTYYVYISAKDGREVNTLRVVKTSSGYLLS